MNAVIDFATITNPIPEPYDTKNPDKQRENFYFVLNQVIDQLKQQGATLDLDVTQAVLDLSYAGTVVDLPGLNIKRTGKLITIEYTP